MKYRFPTSSDRQLVCGRTGSGKTVAACWNLSQRNFRSVPWIVLNHKNTRLIDSIEGANHVDVDYVPKKPGLYVYHPIPEDDDEAVTKLLWSIYARGNTGVYVDEALMLNPRDPSMRAILTQGREKKIPVIAATQRPMGLSRYMISEADFFQVFQLTDEKDIQRIGEIVPGDLKHWLKTKANETPRLGAHCSLWYDVKANQMIKLNPVPDEKKILEYFENALRDVKKRRSIFF